LRHQAPQPEGCFEMLFLSGGG